MSLFSRNVVSLRPNSEGLFVLVIVCFILLLLVCFIRFSYAGGEPSPEQREALSDEDGQAARGAPRSYR